MLLGVEMDHMLGSKWQITELIGHGFNVKVTRYKQSTVVKKCVNDIIKSVMQGYFSQWSGNNGDHNVPSLNGKRVLHRIGVVVLSTSLSDNEARKLPSLPAITFPSLQPKDLHLDTLWYALILKLNQNLIQARMGTC